MSKAALASLILVIIIIAGVALYAMTKGGGQTTQTAPATTTPLTTTTTAAAAAGQAKGLPEEIPIGLAIAVSGGYAVDGPRRLKGALLAIEEMNQLLEQVNAPFKFKPIHEDTKTNPQEAVNVVKRFISQGIQVIIGPLSTSETAAVMPIANDNHVVVISPSSTGKAAAFPDDYVFRMPPPDTAQGPALAKLIYKLGYDKLVIIARNDDYGKGLADLVEKTFKDLGGQVKVILYHPEKPDLSQEVNSLATEVSKFGADEHTAVLIIAFDNDGRQILERASKIDVLGKVQWFGPDSMGRKTFLETPEIAEFLAKVKIYITTPAIPDNPVKKHFEEAYKNKYGEAPTPYAYYAYDAAWVAMLSVLTAGQYDGQAIKAVLPTVAFHYMGATGHKILNENGDAAIADYAISTVVKTDSGYAFKQVGILRGATGTIEWKE
ncbi:MAG: ABC transporter substrate-binding protein [Desulfurococcales archaeon]|nr:ABC transporter substrate-binding protein [Desulfurococcales archaeon]